MVDFDGYLASHRREQNSIIWGYIIAWIISFLLSVGVIVGLIYLVCHFAAKFW